MRASSEVDARRTASTRRDAVSTTKEAGRCGWHSEPTTRAARESCIAPGRTLRTLQLSLLFLQIFHFAAGPTSKVQDTTTKLADNASKTVINNGEEMVDCWRSSFPCRREKGKCCVAPAYVTLAGHCWVWLSLPRSAGILGCSTTVRPLATTTQHCIFSEICCVGLLYVEVISSKQYCLDMTGVTVTT